MLESFGEATPAGFFNRLTQKLDTNLQLRCLLFFYKLEYAPCPGIPIPKPPEKLKDISSGSEEDDGSDDDFNAAGSNDPQHFSQSELNDLVRLGPS
ncbi:hypothetical protein AVEN_154433-1 [Araneus ventricosus]|uniref:Uncharacterized protein n=1 Tax=Araneus ventricosus TaxID=182803 RepID=A0A4Y2HYJ1_ARAVE|nr:hypothetical protein AVEN_154433-1 [Araneus ventricosus]